MSYAMDQAKSAQAWDFDMAAEAHVKAQAQDSRWLDEALSDYVFNSGNEERESRYRQAIFAIYHNNDLGAFYLLINEAVQEKAANEISDTYEQVDGLDLEDQLDALLDSAA